MVRVAATLWLALASAETTFLKCKSRAAIYGAAWVAPASTLTAIPLFPKKDALEFATFHLHQYGTGLKAKDESFWVNHVSGYEHNLWPRYGDAVTKERVTAMVKALQALQCGPRRDAFHASGPGARTLLVVPYHGGANRNVKWSNASRAELAAIPNTGTAHSRADRGVKLRTLHAVLCSGLRIAAKALVGVCADRDADDVTRRVLSRLPADRASVVVLDCAAAPVYLPPTLLRGIQRALSAAAAGAAAPGRPSIDVGGVDFVVYDEADQTLHFERDESPGDVYAALARAPRAFVAPQRYEKRWGADPSLVARGNLSKSMNKCVSDSPAIRSGGP